MSDSLHGQHVIVMGFARQGQALARWLPTVGAQVTVTDMRPAEAFGETLAPYRANGVNFVLGGHPSDLLKNADVLCVSGGVPLTAPLVQAALQQGLTVTNDAQLFLERCPAPVIGITGSAGKTTTTSLVGAMCRSAGRITHVGGNIGDVLLDMLPGIASSGHGGPDHAVVMELSSFQLELVKTSPPVGAILNVTPNHLDRHKTMAAYAAAKGRLIAFQAADGVAILGHDDPGAREMAALTQGRVVWFSVQTVVDDGAYLDDDQLVVVGRSSADGSPQVVVTTDDIRLRGAHNVLNVLAACAIAGAAGVPVAAMRTAIRDFTGVLHRLETVRVLRGVTWVNDSIATAPERVLAAVKSYDTPLVLLLGGRDKDLPWGPLVELAAAKARVVVTFGEHGATVAALLAAVPSQDGPIVVARRSLDEAVQAAARLVQPGDTVLLSPGGTSYDDYLDFEERGVHFRALVAAL